MPLHIMLGIFNLDIQPEGRDLVKQCGTTSLVSNASCLACNIVLLIYRAFDIPLPSLSPAPGPNPENSIS
jgi:hypothetical protein